MRGLAHYSSALARLADAPSGRSTADWLVGMNLSRAYSITYNEELSVGRVQTPTLAMIVDREIALRNFVPEDYIEVVATFQGPENPNKASYSGTWFRPQAQSGNDKDAQAKATRLPADREEANRIVLRGRTGTAAIESLSSQEIERAGRDGSPSRAILMHSYGDQHTHDFFFSRDYPDTALMDRVFASLRAEPQSKKRLRKVLAIEEELFDKIIEKLWIHKGAVLDFAENVNQGDGSWRTSYLTQGEQKRAQIDQMIRFAESNQCRMMSLVRHFGDQSDGATSCGVCDFCAPAECVAQRFRTATEVERAALYRVLSTMRSIRTRSTGKLYADLYPGNEISRDNFEEI